MSKLTIDDLDREIAEAEERRASALEAGWQEGRAPDGQTPEKTEEET